MTSRRSLRAITLILLSTAGCSVLPEASTTRSRSTAPPAAPFASLSRSHAARTVDNSEPLFDRSARLQESGRSEEARELLIRLLKRSPSHDRAVELLVDVSRSLRDERMQQAALTQLIELRPQSAETQRRAGRELLELARRQSEPAVQTVSAESPSVPQETPPLEELALQALRRAVLLEPRNTEAARELAAALVSVDRHAEAEAVLAAAIERNPQDAALAMSAARLFESREHWAQALKCYDLALQSDPGNRLWRRQRGVCESRLGDYAAAAFDLRQALTRTPVRPQLAEYLLWADACLRTGEYQEAEQILEEVVQDGGVRSADIELLRGLVRMRQGRSAEASEIVRRSMSDWPDHPGLLKLAREIEGSGLALSQ